MKRTVAKGPILNKGATTFSVTTFSRMTLCIRIKNVTILGGTYIRYLSSCLYYKSFQIVIYNRNVSTIKLNYDRKALVCVINYDRKCDITIWIVNLMSSFTIVQCL
jgi:hypothetical protein